MKTDHATEPVEIYAGDSMQAGLLKSLLENAEINAYLKDEIMGTLNAWVASPGGAGAVKVLVAGEDAERAKAVVEEFEKNTKYE